MSRGRPYCKVGPRLVTGSFGRSIRGEDVSSLRAQSLASYLCHCPHGNALGLFFLPVGYIMADRGWSSDGAYDALSVCEERGLIRYDRGTEWVLVLDLFRHEMGPDPQRSEDDGKKEDSRLPLVRSLVKEAAGSGLLAAFMERHRPSYSYLLGWYDGPCDAPSDAPSMLDGTPRSRARVRVQDQDQDQDQETPQPPTGGPSAPGESPAWAVQAAKGAPHTAIDVRDTICRCIQYVTWGDVNPKRAATDAKSILGLWRALGRPPLEEFEPEWKDVADAAHNCPHKVFSRDIRAEGWDEGVDRQFTVATIAVQSRWTERLTVAQQWKARIGQGSEPEVDADWEQEKAGLQQARSELLSGGYAEDSVEIMDLEARIVELG